MEYKNRTTEEQERFNFEQFNEDFRQTILPVSIFVSLEACFGFIGNLCVIYVFLCRYRACNFRNFVLFLAFTDIFSCSVTMPVDVYSQLNYYKFDLDKLCKIKSFFNMFTVMAEAFCLLTIAIDRFRKVCRPFGWQISQNISIVLGTIIYLASAVLAMPTAFFWGSKQSTKIHDGLTLNVTICTRNDKYGKINFIWFVFLSFIVALSMFVMSLLYINLYRRLRCQRKSNTKVRIKFKAVPPASAISIVSTSNRDTSESSNTDKCITDQSDLTVKSEEPPGNVANLDRAQHNSRVRDEAIDKSDRKTSETEVIEVDSSGEKNICVEGHKKEQNSLCWKTRQKQAKAKVKRSSRKMRRNTKIMLLLTIIFVVTESCYGLVGTYNSATDDFETRTNFEEAVYIFFLRLYFVNYVVNPIIYAFFDPHFRNILLTGRACKCRV